ncbi:MAG: tRNA pseudouridine(55) synthase TruB [Victivallales bacterium]|nr:tRNA pseudouridine(55) synthase TruB [Victivallales bacterium]
MERIPPNDISGILLVDKPQDWTSQDAVSCIKHRFHLKKVGHCGTLDPMATGLLVLLFGKCTKLQDSLMAKDKVYRASMRLGIETDTEDATGNAVAEHSIEGIDEEAVRKSAQSLIGELMQVPPMVSAIKRNGKKLYELARKGITVEREPRQISIFSIKIERISLPDVDFIVHCSKGTYVRTLCADWGRALGCGANMTALRRLRSGEHSVENAYTMDTIKGWKLPQFQEALVEK